MAKQFVYYKEGMTWPTVLQVFPYKFYLNILHGPYAYEVAEWGECNLTEDFVIVYCSGAYLQLRFKNHKDAILFRLKWGAELEMS